MTYTLIDVLFWVLLAAVAVITVTAGPLAAIITYLVVYGLGALVLHVPAQSANQEV